MINCDLCSYSPAPGTPYENSPCARCPTFRDPVPLSLLKRRDGDEFLYDFLCRVHFVMKHSKRKRIFLYLIKHPYASAETLSGKLEINIKTIQYHVGIIKKNLPEIMSLVK